MNFTDSLVTLASSSNGQIGQVREVRGREGGGVAVDTLKTFLVDLGRFPIIIFTEYFANPLIEK